MAAFGFSINTLTLFGLILAVAIGGNSLGGGKFSLAGSVIGAFTIQALTTTLYAMHVSSDQVPVYKAIVVVIIVALQSPGFARWRKSLLQKKEIKAGKEAA
jgi:ribose/xylose/arabinose/galactoside ABC-type transport system permease subunit